MGIDSRFLITGSGGQLGRAFVKALPGAVHLDRDRLDITDPLRVAELVNGARPEVVVNAAAYTKVDQAEIEPEAAQLANATAVEHLARACAAIGAVLVQVSTDYVFDGVKDSPYSEEDITNPLSQYGRSKLSGEEAARDCPGHLVVRTSWVYGDGHNFIRSILEASKSRLELEIVDDQIGRPTYAPDLARGILELERAGARGTYHLAGGGEPCSWADLAEAAIALAGRRTSVKRISTEQYYAGRQGPIAPRPKNSVLDCSKAARVGVQLRDWREALSEYVETLP